ncbi:hypothetical protein [Candidatus Hepatoplasma crinochetorum]|uniref:hypothetical protein n=1 Tax=Candidatus Hepatoplasma crinochetorum TaxID=295596 RepID=UPI003F65C64D
MNNNISELFKDNNSCAYILGSIFAYQYKIKDFFISVFSGRNQEKTNHFLLEENFYNQLESAFSYYKDLKYLKIYKKIKDNELINKKLKNQIGYFSLFYDDINKSADFEILFSEVYKLIEKFSKNFSINLLRGIIDSRSSADTTLNYISMDIKRENSTLFVMIIQKIFEKIFGKNNANKFNLNPRYKQKSKLSRKKNPQLRIPYTILFGEIGTFKKIFLKKLSLNKKEYERFEKRTKIPVHFDSLIKWNTNNIKYNPRKSYNYNDLNGDVEYFNNKNFNEKLLSESLKHKYNNIKIKNNYRQIKNYDNIKKIIISSNNRDFLEQEKKLEINKNGDPILDLHHIIPIKFCSSFEYEEDINSFENLVPLSPDIHTFLHRGKMNKKKINYLEKLYNHVLPLLEKRNLNKKINFSVFIKMY